MRSVHTNLLILNQCSIDCCACLVVLVMMWTYGLQTTGQLESDEPGIRSTVRLVPVDPNRDSNVGVRGSILIYLCADNVNTRDRVYNVYCTLYTIHYTLYIVHMYRVHNIHYTMYNVHCTMYHLQYIMYIIHYIHYIQCTLYTV